jgi:nucleotide-binding universal stress UspA family protein
MTEGAAHEPEVLVHPTLTVVLATDGSEHALKAARFLAGMLSADQAAVRLLTVLSTELGVGKEEWADGDGAPLARMQAAAEGAVAESRRILEDAGQTTMTSIRVGYAPDEILAEIDECQPDLVVVGRRGRSRPASVLLGSVSDFLLRRSKYPVLVVP